MLSVSSCCCAETVVENAPTAAKVVAPVSAAPLRNDRREDPDWLSTGERVASISFCVFICGESPSSIPGKDIHWFTSIFWGALGSWGTFRVEWSTRPKHRRMSGRCQFQGDRLKEIDSVTCGVAWLEGIALFAQMPKCGVDTWLIWLLGRRGGYFVSSDVVSRSAKV